MRTLSTGIAAIVALACTGTTPKPAPDGGPSEPAPETRVDLAAAPVMAAAWTEYFGSHYTASAWAGSIRDIRLPTAPRRAPGAPAHDDSIAQAYASTWGPLVSTHDVLVPPGGLGSATDPGAVAEFLSRIRTDGGAAWRDTIHARAGTVKLLIEKAEGIYFQIGNEINGPAYSRSIREWKGAPRRERFNDPDVIPVYVEYYLAPAVEALRSFDWGSASAAAKVRTILGSVTNAAHRESREWLGELLRYRVNGDYAESLAGATVSELVDIVSIHYLVTADDASWMHSLDTLYDQWVISAPPGSLWATEELGRRAGESGLGAVTTLKVLARYLHWWSVRGLTPEESRCFFWGPDIGKAGRRGNDALETLYEFLGDTRLADVTGLLHLPAQEGLETYAFESRPDGDLRTAILLTGRRWREAALKTIGIQAGDWDRAAPGTIHMFSSTGHERWAVEAELRDSVHVIDWPPERRVPSRSAVLVALSRPTASGP